MEQLLEYRKRLVECLARQPDDLVVTVRAMPEAEWMQRRSAEGKSVHQLAAHIRDLEQLAFLPRFCRVLDEARPELQPFASHEWSAEFYRPDEPMQAILDGFRQARQAALDRIRGMSDADWSREGFHPPSGSRTAQWWAERMYNHALEHLWEIQQAR